MKHFLRSGQSILGFVLVVGLVGIFFGCENLLLPRQVSTPTFTPGAGPYDTDQTVEIATTTLGATIHYTLDGSDPTTSSSEYSSPIDVSGDGTTVTIKAFGVKEGMTDSTLVEGIFTIDYTTVSTPFFDPVGGTYNSDLSVSLSTNTDGASIYFTTDGSAPTTDSSLYSTPVEVSGDGTTLIIRAYAVKDGMTDSDVSTATYSVDYTLLVAPTITPAAGEYNSEQVVQISAPPEATAIYYTLDGSEPSQSSAEYSSPIAIDTDTTIKAIYVDGLENVSPTASASFTFYYPVTSVTLTPSSITLIEGSTSQLQVEIAPANATNKRVDWASSAVSVATISTVGTVTGVAPGTATISVTSEDGNYTDSAEVTVEPAPEYVSGIINTDTVWAYPSHKVLSSDIQIDYGAKLTVEAGVKITGNKYQIRVWGDLSLDGTSNRFVDIENTHIVPEGYSSSQLFNIIAVYARFSGGSLSQLTRTGNWYGSMTIADSLLSGLPQVYVASPDLPVEFSRNYFDDTAGLYVSNFGSQGITIQNNYFSQPFGEYAVTIRDYSAGTPLLSVTQNTFGRTDEIAIGFSWLGSNAPNLDATNNYWSTTNTAVIDSMIYDKNDDLENPIVIEYSPILSAGHVDTPDLANFE
jgi:hypothetical protein